MSTKAVQALLTAAIASVTYYIGAVAVSVIVLAAVMIIDYATGMISAWCRGELSSREGIFGIVKKLCYLFAVASAAVVDWLIGIGFGLIGISSGINMLFGVLVTIWLIINELISILENLTEIGVPLPAFLMSIVRKLKITAELSADNEIREEKHDE